MLILFYVLAAILVWLSLKSFLGGISYLKYFREELAKPPSDYTPFVSVIVPCREAELGLADNLNAVVSQDHPNFEVIFVVDDETDPAAIVINGLPNGGASVGTTRSNGWVNTKLVIAPKALHSGQKVENLRHAVQHLSSQSAVIVFTDSDARPARDWLRALVAPLEEKNVGAATGYRWFVSENPTFTSEMRSVWNASIASALGPNRRSNFTWGGSTAIPRDTFEKLDIRAKWDGTLSDDFVLARTVKAAGLKIVFVPKALNASIGDVTFGELIEFTNRQMKLTRVYATPLWMMTLVGTGLFNAVMTAALAIVIFSKTNSLAVWVSIAMLALVSMLSIGKAWLRLKAVKLARPQYADQLRRQFVPQITLWLMSPALFFINSVVALFSRRITWRGITYELKSPTETVIIAEIMPSIFDEQDEPKREPKLDEEPLYRPVYEPETTAETVRRSGLAYSAGIVFVGSVAFMLFLGWGADLLFGSSPWGLVAGIVIGSIIGFTQFFRLTSQIFKSNSDTPTIQPLMSQPEPPKDDRPL